VNDKLFIRLFDEMYTEEKKGLNATFVAENLVNFTFSLPVPKLMDENYVEMVKVLVKSTESFLKTLFGTSLVLSIFLAVVLQYIWGMINTLQIIVLTCLFTRLEIPMNADEVMKMILRLCALDFMQVDKVLGMFGFRDTDAFDLIPDDEGNTTSKWQEVGFESSNFIQLLGPVYIIVHAYLIFVIIKWIAEKICVRCGDNFITRRVRSKIDFPVIITRFMLEGAIGIGLPVLISLVMVSMTQA